MKNRSKNTPAPTDTQDSARRSVGVLGAMSIGVGGMVGGGIFAVLGTAVSLAGGGTPVAFAIAGAIALISSYAYAKLSVHFPSAGGTVVFVDRAFGVSLYTGSVNVMLWFCYLVTIALYASAFGSYGLTFFDSGDATWARPALISVAIIVPAIINLLDADFVSRSETYIVIGKLLILAVVVIAAIPSADFAALSPEKWSDPLSLVAGGMVIFVAFEGFELIANAAEDVRDPSRTLPRAFYGSVCFVIVLYIVIAAVTVGSVPADEIARVQDYALAEAAKPSLGQFGFTLVVVAALMATFSAINATIYGNARLGYTLAMEHELPTLLDRKTWNRPLSGVLVTAVLSLFLANAFDLTAIAILGSAGFLIIFAIVNGAAFKLAKTIGARRWICALGCLVCTAALVTLLVHTYEETPHALWTVLGMIGLSFAFEYSYSRLHD